MGFLKSIGNGFADLVKGDFDGMVDNFGSAVGAGGGGGGNAGGGSSSPVLDELTTKAIALLKERYLKERTDFYIKAGDSYGDANELARDGWGSYINTSEYSALLTQMKAELSSGSSSEGLSVKNVLNQITAGVVNGVSNGIQNAIGNTITTAANNGAQSILGSNKAQSIQDQIGNFFGGMAGSATNEFFKKNWYWFVVPGGLLVFALIRLMQPFLKKKGTTSKTGGLRKRR